MTLIGFRSSNHPQQVEKRGAVRDVDDRATTPDLFMPLNDRFGFTIDVAASAENTKCERSYTVADNGLGRSWASERVWCNPPYSAIGPWVQKAWHEWRHAPGQRKVEANERPPFGIALLIWQHIAPSPELQGALL